MILIILAVVRMNSIESQLVKAFGEADTQSYAMIGIGTPSILVGLWFLLSSSKTK